MKEKMNQEQRRASFAYEKVQEVLKKDGKAREDYCIQARKLPAMLHTNGLLASIAFLQSKTEGHQQLYRHLKQYLKLSLAGETESEWDVKAALMEVSGAKLLYVTQEAMALSAWMKRMVEALDEK